MQRYDLNEGDNISCLDDNSVNNDNSRVYNVGFYENDSQKDGVDEEECDRYAEFEDEQKIKFDDGGRGSYGNNNNNNT